jgi:hypothetical protein
MFTFPLIKTAFFTSKQYRFQNYIFKILMNWYSCLNNFQYQYPSGYPASQIRYSAGYLVSKKAGYPVHPYKALTFLIRYTLRYIFVLAN